MIESCISRKYLLYAIGEIALVVIGILIALQINNWNEDRKTQMLELSLLSELRRGLENDIADLEYNTNAHRELQHSQNILVDWLDSERPYHDSLSRHFARINAGTVFVAEDAPYNTLKDVGMAIISSKPLRRKIARVYDIDYDYYLQHVVMINDYLLYGWKEVNPTYFPATLPRLASLANEMRPLDIQKIRNDNEYKHYVKTFREINTFYLGIIVRAETSAKELAEMIDAELEARTR